MTNNYSAILAILEQFLASGDFKAGVVSSTRASWGGSGYSVELYPDETWRVLWNNEIGNRYNSPGVILGLPVLDDSDQDGGEEYFDLAFEAEREELARELREALREALQ